MLVFMTSDRQSLLPSSLKVLLLSRQLMFVFYSFRDKWTNGKFSKPEEPLSGLAPTFSRLWDWSFSFSSVDVTHHDAATRPPPPETQWRCESSELLNKQTKNRENKQLACGDNGTKWLLVRVPSVTSGHPPVSSPETTRCLTDIKMINDTGTGMVGGRSQPMNVYS